MNLLPELSWSEQPLCKSSRSQLADNQVTAIRHNSLTGPLPNELSNLTELIGCKSLRFSSKRQDSRPASVYHVWIVPQVISLLHRLGEARKQGLPRFIVLKAGCVRLFGISVIWPQCFGLGVSEFRRHRFLKLKPPNQGFFPGLLKVGSVVSPLQRGGSSGWLVWNCRKLLAKSWPQQCIRSLPTWTDPVHPKTEWFMFMLHFQEAAGRLEPEMLQLLLLNS